MNFCKWKTGAVLVWTLCSIAGPAAAGEPAVQEQVTVLAAGVSEETIEEESTGQEAEPGEQSAVAEGVSDPGVDGTGQSDPRSPRLLGDEFGIDLAVRAQAYLCGPARSCKHKQERIQLFPRRYRYTLYHLPNGQPASIYPRGIREVDEIRLKIVLPSGFRVIAEVTECEDGNPARVQGSYQAATPPRPGGEEVDEEEENDFKEHYLGTLRGCSEGLEFSLDVATLLGDEEGDREVEIWSATAENSLRISPVYRFAWSFMPTFDFASRAEYSIGERPTDASEDTAGIEKYVSRSTSQDGLRPGVALTVFPHRADPNSRFGNLGLTLAVDPRELTGGMVGLSYFLGTHFGITGGISLYGQDQLKENSNIADGDAWSTPGDLPVETGYFSWDNVGLFLGFNLAPALFRTTDS